MRHQAVRWTGVLAAGLAALCGGVHETAAAPSPTAATVGSDRLTVADLERTVAPSLADDKKIYEAQLKQLEFDYARERQALLENEANRFLDNRALDLEAEAQHISRQQLLAQLPAPTVSDDALRARYDEHKAGTTLTFEEAKPQILDVMRGETLEQARRDYIDGLRSKYHAKVVLEPMRTTVAATGPARGPQSARVTIVEFADFECPFCRQMAPVFAHVIARHPDDIRFVFRQLPLDNLHPHAMRAAQAAVCADRQGKFWPMYEALFAGSEALDDGGLLRRAERVQLDGDTFRKCLAGPDARAAIAADVAASTEAGVQGTPGIFINGRFLNGAVPESAIEKLVEDELGRTRDSGARTAANGR